MPVYQEPDAAQFQQFPTHNIIVIHPGSLYIRMGRASDLIPVKSLHCIARRRKPGGTVYKDPFIPPAVVRTKELVEEMEECRLQISHSLQSCMQSNGARRYATPPQQIAAFNRRSAAEDIEETTPDWLKFNSDTIVGDQVLNLNPDDSFNVHFPYKRGDLNVHSGVSGSLSSVLTDLVTIWRWMIQFKLGIPITDLEKYRCVLLIPDIYKRGHLKHLVSVILNELGFGNCFLVQESVGATFGAGLGYACVVDVGDQKTAVSCVEDGISHKTTRLRMDYGSGDVCQTLAWLVQKSAFPYTQWNEKLPQDAMLMRTLYQDFCHINLDVCGPQEKYFTVHKPGTDVKRYTLQVGDECIISPLAMFNTDLLSITGPKNTQTQTAQSSDPEDPFDAEYLRETGRKKENAEGGGGVADITGGYDGNIEIQQSGNADEDIVVDALEVPVAEGLNLAPEQILGLDAAVLKSIDRCPNEELKRKMYASILIVGGGIKIQGLTKWLQNKLALQIPYLYRSDQIDNVVCPKDTDPAATAWKGAAIMSCLESSNELWIKQSEWRNMHGVKILRERAPFIW